jgi:hypothetical protein
VKEVGEVHLHRFDDPQAIGRPPARTRERVNPIAEQTRGTALSDAVPTYPAYPDTVNEQDMYKDLITLHNLHNKGCGRDFQE